MKSNINKRVIRYEPTPVALLFHRSPRRARIFFGGNRSGKTHAGAAEAVLLSCGKHEYRKIQTPNIGWVSVLDLPIGRQVIKPKIEFMLKLFVGDRGSTWEWHERDNFYTVNTPNGESRIYLKSVESGAGKYQSSDIDWLWCDEEHPSDIMREAEMRLIDRSGCFFCTMTPLRGRTHTYYSYIEDHNGNDIKGSLVSTIGHSFVPDKLTVLPLEKPRPVHWENALSDHAVFKASMLDNYNESTLVPNLPPKELAAAAKRLFGTALYRARIYGDFVNVEGLVYPQFSDHNVLESLDNIPEDWVIYNTIDWGFNAKSVCLFIAFTPNKKRIIFDEIIMQHCTHNDFLQKIAAHRLTGRVNRRIADPNMPAAIEEARRLHIPMIPAPKKEIMDGVSIIQQDLNGKGGEPALMITRNCKHTISEFRAYSWRKVIGRDGLPKDVPEDKNNDAMDAIRQFYYVPFLFPKERSVEKEYQPLPYAEAERIKVWKSIKDKRAAYEKHLKMSDMEKSIMSFY